MPSSGLPSFARLMLELIDRLCARSDRAKHSSSIIAGGSLDSTFVYHVSNRFDPIDRRFSHLSHSPTPPSLGHSCRCVIDNYFKNSRESSAPEQLRDIEKLIDHRGVLFVGSGRTNVIASGISSTYGSGHVLSTIYGRTFRKPYGLVEDNDTEIVRLIDHEEHSEHPDKVSYCNATGSVDPNYRQAEAIEGNDRISTDYALVSVLPNPLRADGKIVQLEGGTGVGTEAISKLQRLRNGLSNETLAEVADFSARNKFYQVLLRASEIKVNKKNGRHSAKRLDVVDFTAVQEI